MRRVTCRDRTRQTKASNGATKTKTSLPLPLVIATFCKRVLELRLALQFCSSQARWTTQTRKTFEMKRGAKLEEDEQRKNSFEGNSGSHWAHYLGARFVEGEECWAATEIVTTSKHPWDHRRDPFAFHGPLNNTLLGRGKPPLRVELMLFCEKRTGRPAHRTFESVKRPSC